jgi:threonylcarbamoyladenosine tRNA methylthiotransferase MtaB
MALLEQKATQRGTQCNYDHDGGEQVSDVQGGGEQSSGEQGNNEQDSGEHSGDDKHSGGGKFDGPWRAHGRVRALVKIQDGCGRRCSYCIIPDVRGPSRSREAADILREVASLAERGVREAVLTGIHISSYGLDSPDQGSSQQRAPTLSPRPSLGELIAGIAASSEGTGLSRLRLSSLEPADVTPEFVDALARSRGILCPHFHLSLQSGSAGVLDRMNRRYSPAAFLKAVAMLRGAFPGAAVTTDVIVGFPGETDAEFGETLALCREAAFSMIHVFKYSQRPGTPAATMRGQVAAAVKAARSNKLLALADSLAAAFNHRFIGQAVSVLVETARPANHARQDYHSDAPNNTWIEGTTAHYVKARAQLPACQAVRLGELCDMRVEFADAEGVRCSGMGDKGI